MEKFTSGSSEGLSYDASNIWRICLLVHSEHVRQAECNGLHPVAARAVDDAFYVDDGVTGAASIEEAIQLHHQLQSLLQGRFFTTEVEFQ